MMLPSNVKVKKFIVEEKALGLVEALIAIAIVGTAMVIITRVSLRTIKQARKNELQDVAFQSAVEAIDYMKQPGAIAADLTGGTLPGYFELDLAESPEVIVYPTDDELTVNDTCNSSSSAYYVDDLSEAGYNVCRQIYIAEESTDRYEIKVIVLWQTVGGGNDIRYLEGFRAGKINF